MATSRAPEGRAAGAYRLSPPRVLALCHSRSQGGAIVRLFQKRGLSATYALGESDVLQQLAWLPFDLLLIDVPEGRAEPNPGRLARLATGSQLPVLLLAPSSGGRPPAADGVFFLQKPVSWDRVVRSIDGILAGGRLPGSRAGALEHGETLSSSLPRAGRSLSPRELEVLRHMVDGLANKVIAREMEISEPTVKKHVQRIVGKLNAADRAQAAAIAVRAGLVR